MRDEAEALDLLRTARETLADEVLPSLAGGQRYTGLMVANALRMVERALARRDGRVTAERAVLAFAAHGQGDDEDARRALRAAIRAGRHDADASLHGALEQHAVEAVGVTRPELLTPLARNRNL